jgi:hypothetical protein
MGALLTVVVLAWMMTANLIFVGLAGGITPSFENALINGSWRGQTSVTAI